MPPPSTSPEQPRRIRKYTGVSSYGRMSCRRRAKAGPICNIGFRPNARSSRVPRGTWDKARDGPGVRCPASPVRLWGHRSGATAGLVARHFSLGRSRWSLVGGLRLAAHERHGRSLPRSARGISILPPIVREEQDGYGLLINNGGRSGTQDWYNSLGRRPAPRPPTSLPGARARLVPPHHTMIAATAAIPADCQTDPPKRALAV